MIVLRISLAAILGGFFIVSSVKAETVCGVRDDFVATLQFVYAERIVGQGLTPDGRLVELALSADGSFTILMTTSVGTSCVLLVGSEWERLENFQPDPPKIPLRAPQ